jgi:hypothetical protein
MVMSNNEYPYDYNGQDAGRRQAWGEATPRRVPQQVHYIATPPPATTAASYDLQRRLDALRDQIQRDMAEQRAQIDEVRRQTEALRKQSKGSQLLGLLPMLLQSKAPDLKIKKTRLQTGGSTSTEIEVVTDAHYDDSGSSNDSMLPIVLTLALTGGLGSGGDSEGGNDGMALLPMLLLLGNDKGKPRVVPE